jgi:peptidoglycan/LPS O-acetylase OafA/YrhL
MPKLVSYFNGLNALRFFAASLVVFHHAEQIRSKSGLFNLKSFSFFNNGGIAVAFFFILSGFLITYLLLKERSSSGVISIKKFYYRRILRIWPLYYLLVFLGTLLIPFLISYLNISYEMPYTFSEVILFFVFFAPFMVTFIFGHHLLEPLWSIGVEEIFYIFWAPLLNYVNLSVAKISVFIIVFKFLLVWFSPYFIENELYFQLLGKLQFESMAVGALGAVWVFNYQEQLRSSIFIFHRLSQIILMSFITIRIVFFDYLISNVNVFAFIQGTFIFNLAVNFLFLWLILNVSLNKDSLIKFNSRVFNFLGDISYGIYMYHMLVIFTIMHVLKDYLIRINEISATILFYFLVFSGTIFVSYVSKQYFENYFIKLKSKYRL